MVGWVDMLLPSGRAQDVNQPLLRQLLSRLDALDKVAIDTSATRSVVEAVARSMALNEQRMERLEQQLREMSARVEASSRPARNYLSPRVLASVLVLILMLSQRVRRLMRRLPSSAIVLAQAAIAGSIVALRGHAAWQHFLSGRDEIEACAQARRRLLASTALHLCMAALPSKAIAHLCHVPTSHGAM